MLIARRESEKSNGLVTARIKPHTNDRKCGHGSFRYHFHNSRAPEDIMVSTILPLLLVWSLLGAGVFAEKTSTPNTGYVSGGAVAGIVVGGVCVVALMGLAVHLALKNSW